MKTCSKRSRFLAGLVVRAAPCPEGMEVEVAFRRGRNIDLLVEGCLPHQLRDHEVWVAFDPVDTREAIGMYVVPNPRSHVRLRVPNRVIGRLEGGYL